MKTLFIIPARGGSKGLPNKNIKLICGKPLIIYTLDYLNELTTDEHICVSTDSEAIKVVAENFGIKVPYKRPSKLATDYSGMDGVIIDALDFYEKLNSIEYDNVIILQPTSPLRTLNNIKEAIANFKEDTEMLVSVTEAKSNPYYVLYEEDENGVLKQSKEASFVRRQDCPKVWELNGAIYIMNVKYLKKNKSIPRNNMTKFVMTAENSIDIDNMLDWKLAELILKERNNNIETLK